MRLHPAISRIGVAALIALGALVAPPAPATAAQNLVCRMKGQWLDNPNDVWEFDARYIFNNGEDDFSGIYNNPGQAQAQVVGAARRGIWNILLTYTDAKHQGMTKKLVGKGAKDRVSNTVIVTGDYKTFLANNDIKHDGQFKLQGTCK